MLFLQIVANRGWHKQWIKGDVSSAFLQGEDRDNKTKGESYLRPPKNRKLDGVPPGCLIKVIKFVYGLPDAPRAWWNKFTGFLKNLGFRSNRLDVAFMVKYGEKGDIYMWRTS